ncbi:MAG: hypothetical protein AAF404_17195, partial [Pseudomonadota bacterium]
MLELIRRHPLGALLSVGGHIAIGIFLFISLETEYRDPAESDDGTEPVQAVLVNSPEVAEEIATLRAQVDDVLASLPLEEVPPPEPPPVDEQQLQRQLEEAETLRQEQLAEQEALQLQLQQEEQRRLLEEEQARLLEQQRLEEDEQKRL